MGLTGAAFIRHWENYRDSRTGSFEFRVNTRYKAVAGHLARMGFKPTDTLVDVGAGTCQFGRYLRAEGWTGTYVPIDAVIDGTDLETWTPVRADWVVCIETLEHLDRPLRLLTALDRVAARGLVLTTPNCEAVDVLKCDPTHRSVVFPAALRMCGLTIERHSWFGTPDDSLLAWRQY